MSKTSDKARAKAYAAEEAVMAAYARAREAEASDVGKSAIQGAKESLQIAEFEKWRKKAEETLDDAFEGWCKKAEGIVWEAFEEARRGEEDMSTKTKTQNPYFEMQDRYEARQLHLLGVALGALDEMQFISCRGGQNTVVENIFTVLPDIRDEIEVRLKQGAKK